LALTEAPQRPVGPTFPSGGIRSGTSPRAAADADPKADAVEIVCVIRSRSNPNAKSEIILIEKPSPALLQAITGRPQ
jgi:hypothetical protein